MQTSELPDPREAAVFYDLIEQAFKLQVNDAGRERFKRAVRAHFEALGQWPAARRAMRKRGIEL